MWCASKFCPPIIFRISFSKESLTPTPFYLIWALSCSNRSSSFLHASFHAIAVASNFSDPQAERGLWFCWSSGYFLLSGSCFRQILGDKGAWIAQSLFKLSIVHANARYSYNKNPAQESRTQNRVTIFTRRSRKLINKMKELPK